MRSTQFVNGVCVIDDQKRLKPANKAMKCAQNACIRKAVATGHSYPPVAYEIVYSIRETCTQHSRTINICLWCFASIDIYHSMRFGWI